MTAQLDSGPEAPAGSGGRLLGRVSVRRPRPVLRFLERWSLFVVLVVIWQLVTAATKNPYFPTPVQIARQAGHLWFSGPASHLGLADTVFDDIFPSIGRLLAGWGIAVVLGVLIGLALGRSKVAADYFGGLLAFARSVPPPCLVPVFLVLFKIGPEMEIITIVFGVIWPVLLNTLDGAAAVDPQTMDAARAFHTPWTRRVFSVLLPAASPKIFAGLRVSLSLSFILMVIAELVASSSGIGYQLVFAQGNADLPGMWSWIVLVSALGYLFNSALVIVEHRVLRWYRGATSQLEG
jgi:ABC-type nitrate/sulfonate/bicarbonate transport system permease component